MAQVDPRLQPLFAILNEEGYDWIVSEIIDAIRLGIPNLVGESDLERVRMKIEHEDETIEAVATEEFDTIKPFSGDDQIDLVVELIGLRFKNITQMLDQSRKSLGSISSRSRPALAEPKLAFQIDGENRRITPQDTVEISGRIDLLSKAVAAWSESVRTTTGDAQ